MTSTVRSLRDCFGKIFSKIGPPGPPRMSKIYTDPGEALQDSYDQRRVDWYDKARTIIMAYTAVVSTLALIFALAHR